MRPRTIFGLFLFLAICTQKSGAFVTGMYFTGNDALRFTDDFSFDDPELVTFSSVTAAGLAVDAAGGKIYWTEFGTAKVFRANLDGSGTEDIANGPSGPEGIALDLGAGKVYWTDDIGSIQRANLDGGGVKTVVPGISNPAGLALDLVNGKLYWTDTGTDTVARADLDGSNVETIVPATTGVNAAMAVDGMRGKVYWYETGDASVYRANLDGTGKEFVHSDTGVAALSMDVAHNVLYSATTEGGDQIISIDLDIANEIVAVITEDIPHAMIFDIATNSLWTSENPVNAIRRYRFVETTQLEPLTIGTGDVEVDLLNEKVYWSEWDFAAPGAAIARANLDGTNVEALFPSEISVAGIALDVVGGKLYWTDFSQSLIFRSDWDGDNRETLPIGGSVVNPAGIEVDTANSHIYWANYNGGAIRRADLDGQNSVPVITGLTEPFALALDVAGGKVYWCERGPETLQRANLDGSDLEQIGVTTSLPFDIEMDLFDGKLYWSQSESSIAPELRRMNLDGTGVERVGSTGMWPAGFALVTEPVGAMIGTIVSNIPPNQIREGDHLVLTAPIGTQHAWRLNGALISGANASTLEFNPVTPAHEGTFSVVYNNGLKSVVQSFPFPLEVQPALQVPLSTFHIVAGLALLVCVCGAMRLRIRA